MTHRPANVPQRCANQAAHARYAAHARRFVLSDFVSVENKERCIYLPKLKDLADCGIGQMSEKEVVISDIRTMKVSSRMCSLRGRLRGPGASHPLAETLHGPDAGSDSEGSRMSAVAFVQDNSRSFIHNPTYPPVVALDLALIVAETETTPRLCCGSLVFTDTTRESEMIRIVVTKCISLDGVMSIDTAFPDLISSAIWKETHDVR